jgi:tetratricopeptide (TPR) repeat protein
VEWERLVADLEAGLLGADGEPLPGRESLWVALLGHRAEIAMQHRDFQQAEAILKRLKEHYERNKDEKNMAVAVHQLGRIAEERRQFDEAERWYRQSLEIDERIGDESGQARSLHQLGRIAEEQGNGEQARKFYLQSEALFIRFNDSYNLEIVHSSLKRLDEK